MPCRTGPLSIRRSHFAKVGGRRWPGGGGWLTAVGPIGGALEHMTVQQWMMRR